MGYHDFYRLSAHGVFTNPEGKILLLKATYGDKRWGLPGGGFDPGETVHETLIRECKEELGVDIEIFYMSGMYFHEAYQSHTCIFKCEMKNNSSIQLSSEHSEFKYFALEELGEVQRIRVTDCLQFDGTIKSRKFLKNPSSPQKRGSP
jgi:8-oxo-dGTP diphosphatase